MGHGLIDLILFIYIEWCVESWNTRVVTLIKLLADFRQVSLVRIIDCFETKWIFII
jgi:hypothetical protein